MYITGCHLSNDDIRVNTDAETCSSNESVSVSREMLHEWYLQLFPRVYNFVYARLKNKVDADDVTSEVFLKAVERIGTYDARRGAFSTWVFCIAKTTLINFAKRRNIHTEVAWEEFLTLTTDERTRPENRFFLGEDERAILFAMDKLSPRERRYLELKFWGGLTNRQIAAVDGVSESQVGVTVFRAMGKLRQHLSGAL